MITVRKLGVIAMVALALMLAACTSSTAPPPTSSTSSTAAPTTTQASTTPTEAKVVSKAAACSGSQLTVGLFGSGVGNPGQTVTAIRVKDNASLPCSLRGYPVVTFLNKARAVMRVTVGRTASFYGVLATVVLSPGKAVSAGFIMTGYDFPTTGTTCATASSMRVRLPNIRASFTVSTSIRLCRLLEDTSPIVRGAELAPAL